MQNHLQRIQTLTEAIEANLAEPISIPTLAADFELSPWHFQRLFKSVVGDSLGGYVRGRRLTRGAQQLLESDASILTIAVDMGFNSHEAFSRSFKAHFGLTPKQFRQKRPTLSQKKKPLLTPELLAHVTSGMDLEPIIKVQPATTIIGLRTQVDSPFTTKEPVCNMVGPTWFALFDRLNDIPNRVEDQLVALTLSESGTFTEDIFGYLAGAPVTERPSDIPEGMTSYELPEQQVAIFNTQTNIDAEIAKRTIDYIYGAWFYHAEYQRGWGDDYELFVDIQDAMKGIFTSKYVVPVRVR